MSSEPIFFEFDTERDALLAQDTLEELGYQSGIHLETGSPVLHIIIERNDLTSALEIAQAHGGRLVESSRFPSQAGAYAMAYETDNVISIPAHLVNEDQADAGGVISSRTDTGGRRVTEAESFDPSGEDYDGFDAGIHI